jgi:hypothetical protein
MMVRMIVLLFVVFVALAPAGDAGAPLRVEVLAPAGPAPERPGSPVQLVPTSYDTLRWHDYTVSQYCHGGPTAGDAWLFGLGAKYTPNQYPAIIVGLASRVYRDPQSPTRGLMQIRMCDDDGAGGIPGTIFHQDDCQADTWAWYFPYYRMPYPYVDTINDGSFYLFYLARDSGQVRHTLLWAYDLALNHLEEHWWHQNGQYNVCTSITADLSIGVVVEYPDVGVGEGGNGEPPRALSLGPVEPNPFRRGARVRYALPEPCAVRLDVFDAAGNLVRNLRVGDAPAGWHSTTWNGRDDAGEPVARGLYFCRLEAGGRVCTGKLVKQE